MKHLERRQTVICVTLVLLLVTTLAAGIRADKNKIETEEDNWEEPLLFSHNSGMYSQDITVEIRSQNQGEILYTLDGSTPSLQNGNTEVYDEQTGIFLDCTQQECVYTVKAVFYDEAKDPAGEEQVYSRTYILGSDVQGRYNIPVLAISGDPEELFGKGMGILDSGNRLLKGREYERAVTVALFDSQGEETLSLNCGLRVYGGFSRNKNQPSFRLYARSEYDAENSFNYYLFTDDYNVENVLISQYKRIILRNSGDDNGHAYLRNELVNRLSSTARFPDTQYASPLCVYINGQYYGVYWFVNNYDNWYFEEKYGEYDGRMVVLEGQVSELYEEEDEDEVTQKIRKEYNTFYEYAASADLNVDENWEKLIETIDIENFLQYMAIQNYVCNLDFVVNNFKTYRYYSPEENYLPGTVFDGRYRFLLYDLDESLGFDLDNPLENKAESFRTAATLTDPSIFSSMFNNVMSRAEGREMYIRLYLSLSNYYFAAEQSVPVLYEMHESHADELKYLFNETELLAGNIDMPYDADYGHVLDELEKIQTFLEERPGFAVQDLSKAFGLNQTYELFLSNENQAYINIDYISLHDAMYEGTYFGEVPVTVSVSPRCGYKLDCWVVNGNVIETNQFVITPDMIEDGFVGVECITSPDPEVDLRITEVCSRDLQDYIVLENFGDAEVNLKNYLLWDGEEGKSGSFLPSMAIAPGESVTVYCENYIGAEALWQPVVNFSLKEGETLELYRRGGEMLQSVYIPRLSSQQSVYKMDRYSGIFNEILP